MQAEMKNPLRWPDGWRRTLIDKRIERKQWKKPLAYYRDDIVHELERLKVVRISVTFNEEYLQERDPGVAVWYEMKGEDNFDWQTVLHIDNPLPTIAQIDSSFRELAKRHHPDTGGKDADANQFKLLTDARRQAIAYIRRGAEGTTVEHCIPCDAFTGVRYNLAGIKFALSYFRGLERVGIPGIVHRVMDKTFRTALTEGEKPHVAVPASSR